MRQMALSEYVVSRIVNAAHHPACTTSWSSPCVGSGCASEGGEKHVSRAVSLRRAASAFRMMVAPHCPSLRPCYNGEMCLPAQGCCAPSWCSTRCSTRSWKRMQKPSDVRCEGSRGAGAGKYLLGSVGDRRGGRQSLSRQPLKLSLKPPLQLAGAVGRAVPGLDLRGFDPMESKAASGVAWAGETRVAIV